MSCTRNTCNTLSTITCNLPVRQLPSPLVVHRRVSYHLVGTCKTDCVGETGLVPQNLALHELESKFITITMMVMSYQLLTQQSHLITKLAQQRLLADHLIDMRLHRHPLGRICKVQGHPGIVSCTCTTKKQRLSSF